MKEVSISAVILNECTFIIGTTKNILDSFKGSCLTLHHYYVASYGTKINLFHYILHYHLLKYTLDE